MNRIYDVVKVSVTEHRTADESHSYFLLLCPTYSNVLAYNTVTHLELELATLLLERLRRLLSESPRFTTPLPVMEKCLSL